MMDKNINEIHDLKEAVRTLRLALEEIERGYRFDDGLGEAKKAALRKAVEKIEAWVGKNF